MITGYYTFLLINSLMDWQVKQTAYSNSYNSISIEFINDKNTSSSLLDFLQDEPIGDLNNALLIKLGEDDYTTVIGWKGCDFTRWHALEAGSTFFNDIQSESNDKIAIISSGLAQASMHDKQIYFDDKLYDVVSVNQLTTFMFLRSLPYEPEYSTDEFGNSNTVIMPYKTFIEEGFEVDLLRFDLSGSIHENKDVMTDTILTYFEEVNVYFSNNIYEDAEYMGKVALNKFLLTGLCVITLFNIFALFNYWIKRNRNTYYIYTICGANYEDIFSLILLEWLFINIIAYISAIILLQLTTPILNRLGFAPEYSLGKYILFFLVGTFTSFLFSIKTIVKAINSLYSKNNGGVL